MIWNPNKECMSRDEMSALQGKRLHKIVKYVYHNVPFYRHKLQAMDISITHLMYMTIVETSFMTNWRAI